MSNPAFANAERCSVWTKPNATAPAPFRAWGEALRQAFEVPQDEMEVPVAPLDIEHVRAEAMAQGFAAGIEAGRREADAEREALKALAAALEVLKPEPTQGLGLMIAATVERLVHEVMGEVEVDRGTLIDRAEHAAALIGDETKPAVLKLCPADVARLSGVDLPVAIEADPALHSGELRLETVAGCIEDGPSVRMARLRVALERIAGAQ